MSKKSKKMANRVLHTIYNEINVNGFSYEDYKRETILLQEMINDKGDLDSIDLSTVDHPLLQIIESKRKYFLNEWICKNVPIGSCYKSDQQIIYDFKKLRMFNVNKILRTDNVLYHFSHYANGLNQYFPEILATPTTSKAVVNSLENRKRFYEIYIRKLLMNGIKRQVTTSDNFSTTFHRCYKIGSWTQSAGNFHPMFMKFIVREAFKRTLRTHGRIPNDNFVIIDPCGGWAGRLIGVLSSFNELRTYYQRKTNRSLNVSYITTDVHSKIHDRFYDIVKDWFSHIEPNIKIGDKFHFYKEIIGCETNGFLEFCNNCFEELHVSGANLCMTSPPFFNRERYSDDDAQSYVKYPLYSQWKEKFLNGMITNIHNLLLPEGLFYLNIADIRDNKNVFPLVTDAIELLQRKNFRQLKTYKMITGSMAYITKTQPIHSLEIEGKIYRYEPILMYIK
jgi:hypothetical protein